MIATLTIHLRLPGCNSLKFKRGAIQPLIHRLRREFNVSVAEMGLQDNHDQALIACAMIGNDARFLQSALMQVAQWVEAHWADGDVWDTQIKLD